METVWIIFLVIAGVIVFNFFRDRDQVLAQIAFEGGMAKKYAYLVGRLSAHPSAQIKKQGLNDVYIVSEGPTTKISFYVMENFGTVEIEWLANYGPLGTLKKKWSFPQTRSQEHMVEEIESYVILRTTQLMSGGN